MHRDGARPADGFWRGMPTPSLPPKRALAPPPRLRAKHASFCALCADRPGPASSGAAQQKHRFKNCAKLCAFVQPQKRQFIDAGTPTDNFCHMKSRSMLIGKSDRVNA